MKSSVWWIVIPAFLVACDGSNVADAPVDDPIPIAQKPAPTSPPGRIEVAFSDDPTHIEKAPPAKPPIVYSTGDTFQGMWNYDRRNYSLRLDIVSIDSEERELVATLRSVDLDDVEKEFRGTVGEDGRQLFLTGVAGTGSDYESVSGYDVRDLLRKSSTQTLNLNDCDARKLRGSTDDGTNVYFWSKVKPKS